MSTTEKENTEFAVSICYFAEWVRVLGSSDCEIYKHELENAAIEAIAKIDSFLLLQESYPDNKP